jgi:hypothetical protein
VTLLFCLVLYFTVDGRRRRRQWMEEGGLFPFGSAASEASDDSRGPAKRGRSLFARGPKQAAYGGGSGAAFVVVGGGGGSGGGSGGGGSGGGGGAGLEDSPASGAGASRNGAHASDTV